MKKEPFRSSLEVACMLALERGQTSMGWALLGMILALHKSGTLTRDDIAWEAKTADRIAKQLSKATTTVVPMAYVIAVAETQAENFATKKDAPPPSRRPCTVCNGLREFAGAPCETCKATGLEKPS
jgi:hypothetical protein